MRALLDMDTIQIELTNACHRSCSNCTRFCGHRKPFFLDWNSFKTAIYTMKDYPKMTGFMGGEPLLHPQFKQYCEWARKFIPPERLGLWTALPPGKEHYAEIICETFGHVFVNDHSRNDIYHAPILVSSREIYKDRAYMFYIIDHCWLQNAWSASINPTGAYFCEIAASMALLLDIRDKGWKVLPKWWMRTPKDFTEQVETFCPMCGVCVQLPRRLSIDGRDDVSPGMLNLLKQAGSKKVERNEYVISDLKLTNQPEEMASYKDTTWRNRVAARYGIYLTINQMGFWSPSMLRNKCIRGSIYEEIKERYDASTKGKVEEDNVEERAGASSLVAS